MSYTKKFTINIKASLILMILAIFLSIFVPGVVAEPRGGFENANYEHPIYNDITYNFDEYLTIVNYNEPMNPYVIMNYYYQDGSNVKIIYGVQGTVVASLNLDHQNNLIPVFDAYGNLVGYGVNPKLKSNLFIFVPINN
ncbi:MAG: hypothetical protein KAJ51_12635 [Thermoplasmata archaeon]|nr:hypothetical protein [Thermoplasmata archaeon]